MIEKAKNRPEQILELTARIKVLQKKVAEINSDIKHSSYLFPEYMRRVDERRHLQTDIALIYRKIDNLQLGKSAHGEPEHCMIGGHTTRMPFID